MKAKDYLIDTMNPFLKILVLIVITVIGSLDYAPFISITLILSALVLVKFFTSISIKELLNSIKTFIIMAFGFMIVILVVRGITGENLALISVLGLGFKIILISIYSSIFVKTTDPTEFVIALIKYFKMSPKLGYSFLTAYRFLPTFKEELETIRYAHEVRGVSEGNTFIGKILTMKRYIIPMMANAIRKGTRISMAMETRGFLKYKTRTYYRTLTMERKHTVAAVFYIIYIILISVVFYLNNLTNFGFKYMG